MIVYFIEVSMAKVPTVLVKVFITKNLIKSIDDNFTSYHLWEQADQTAFLTEHGHEIEALVTSAVHGADAALINALPNLKVIASYGVGYDAVDLDLAKQKGIRVTNTPDVLNDCVADTALALLLDVARNISFSDRFVRAGQWKGPTTIKLGHKIGGKVCGIVGLGRIGKAIAKRAEAFDMKIAYYGRHKQQVNYDYYDNLIELAKAADFLVLALPGSDNTHHIINSEILEALGNRGFLINIARGSVVDESALVKALQQGVIAGAGLDVFEHEPNPSKELLTLDNVVLTPHLASSTFETRNAIADLVYANLVGFFDGTGVVTPVV